MKGERLDSGSRPSDTRPSRVMMCVPKYPYPIVGGLEKQAHELAKALRVLGVHVRVVSATVSPGTPAREWVEGVEVIRLRWSNSRLLRFPSLTVQLLWTLYRERHSFDVLHSHQFSWYGLLVIVAGKMMGKPVLTKLPNVGTHGLPGLRANPFGALKIAIFRQSTAVVAMSDESLGELRDIGYPLARVLATPNGIEVKTPSGDLPRGKRAHDGCRVVFVGRLTEEKGLGVLLKAWPEVLTRACGCVTLELWGSGPSESKIDEACRRLGIAHSVRLVGHVQEVRKRLREMDIFVLPSRAEGNSNAILEAMAEGLPIVSTPVGGTPLLVGPEGAPFLVAPEDASALARAIVTLVNEPETRLELGRAMLKRVADVFDIATVARTYSSAYAALARGDFKAMRRSSSDLFHDYFERSNRRKP